MKNYFNPVKVLKSNNWATDLQSCIEELKIFNPIIVTSFGRKKDLGLENYFKSSSIYCNVTENPTFEDCDKAISFCKNKDFDSVIAIGGGSVMDLSKVVMAYVSSNEEKISSLFAMEKVYENATPAIFLPTTHGTGSEVTMWGTIWNMEEKKKYSISNLSLYPKIAILDPSLTLTLPLNISIITLMDALSHSFEAIWNVNCNSHSTTLAIEAISLILQNIQDFKKNPNDSVIRNKLLNASNKAGLAFSNTKTAAAHSISYPLTIHFGIPHGIASSITILELLKINRKAIEPALKIILEKNSTSFSNLIKMIESIPSEIVPFSLSEWGIKEDYIDFIVDRSFTKDRMENNIIKLSKHDIKEVIKKVY